MSKVRIIYKSGVIQDIKCSGFKCKFSYTNELASVEWEEPSPRPLYIGVDNIAAIYEL